MKGYLQRMAASAVRPQSGIHPLVGSIYAGRAFADAPRDAAAESGVHEEERWTTTPQPVGEQRDAGVEPDASPFRESAKSEVAQRRLERSATEASRYEERIDAQRAPFRPLLAAAAAESAESSGYDSAADAERHVRSGDGFEREDSERSRAGESGFEALLPRESRSPLAVSGVRRAKAAAFQHSAPAEREPDKVEIHIGRIEVTAVPQEAPRPPATRPRKSLDLGEYLKRRDGRTG
jgi:hypothetical protein